ncbi:MAG: nucleotide exchange factor GrpE [Nitrospirae bacterium]|nr:MAG: nucleotide exchange factor GrpE [Nitrospirota bacterium]
MRKKSDSVEKTGGSGTFDKSEPSVEEAASDADATAAEMAESASSASEQQGQSLEEELKVTQDRYLRLAAEFENYKKRVQKDQVEYTKYATERLLRELLPVLDNLQRALRHAQQSGGKAVATVDPQGQVPNTMVEEYEKGYYLHDRVLRPAMVTVAASGPDECRDAPVKSTP